MADPIINLLKSRTVLINTNTTVGTGSFIATGFVLTCAHVVRAAAAANESIEIRFQIEEQSDLTTAKVIKVHLSEQLDEKEYPDIAVLEIEQKDHPILRIPSEKEGFGYSTSREYFAFGFQKKDRDTGRNIAQTISLSYEGEEDAGYLRKIIYENGLIRPGMSGAPLVDRETGQITGIVQKSRNPNTDLGAYTIPFEKIWETFKKWENEGKNRLYSILNSKKHRYLVRKEYNKEYPRFPLLQRYWIRMSALLLSSFAGLWWIFLNLGPIKNSAAVSAIFVALPFLGYVLSNMFGPQGSTENSRINQKITRVALHPLMLLVAGIMVTIAWYFLSSVWVYGSRDNAGQSITLFQDTSYVNGRFKAFNEKGETHFLVRTNPWGVPYGIQPEGREVKDISVASGLKKELVYPTDFIQEPVLLVRFNPMVLSFDGMKNYILKLQIEGKDFEFVDSTLQKTGALLFGSRKLRIDQSRVNTWLQKDDMQSMASMPEMSKYINMWKSYKQVKALNFNLGDSVIITLINKNDGNVKVRKSIKFLNDENDILINPL